MPAVRHVARVDTLELRLQIERKVGPQRSDKYFNLLNRYLSGKIIKSEFDKVCIGLVGRENIRLHNELIKAILRNAYFSKTPPPTQSKNDGPLSGKVQNGCQRSSLQSLCRDVLPHSPRKGRTPNLRERKFKDRPSPLGLHEKAHKVQEQQSATELFSLGSKPPVEVISVEEGEEVEQAAISPGIYSRSPVKAPLGISIYTKQTRKILFNRLAASHYTNTCQNGGELPDTSSLEKRLKEKLGTEGFGISADCVNLLNNGLDAFLKRLIKAGVGLPASRSEHKQQNQAHYPPTFGLNGMPSYVQNPKRPYSASMLDFRAAMELNPRLLGVDWPVQFEKRENIIFCDGGHGITRSELYGFGFAMEFTLECTGLLNPTSAYVFKHKEVYKNHYLQVAVAARNSYGVRLIRTVNANFKSGLALAISYMGKILRSEHYVTSIFVIISWFLAMVVCES